MKVKKKKPKLKNPILRWMCIRCYHYRSDKFNPEINAVTLKCSLCDNFLISENDFATCPNDCGITILKPKCSKCGEKMIETEGTLKDLLVNNPIDTEIALDYQKLINKKPWWKI